jgi:ABC-type glycerol-3-phosphate transport system substrate-binding protein
MIPFVSEWSVGAVGAERRRQPVKHFNPMLRSARRVMLTMAAASLAVGLASCGGGQQAGGDNTVTVWHYFSEDFQVQLMEEYARKFESSHQGAKVENVFVPYDNMNSKLLSAAGAQSGPDVVVFNGAEASTLALGGALAPLDKQWGAYEDAGQFPESVQHTIDGQLYAVQGYVNLLGLWYNADILQEIGVGPPSTMQELEAAMAAAKRAGYTGITLSALPNSQGEWQAYPWLTSQGFDYENPDQAALAEGLARIRGWVEKGYLSQEATTWDQTVPFQRFTAGGVAFAENGNWQIGAAEADAKFEYGVVPLPLGEEGQVYLGGEGVGIGAFADDPDLAWDYLTETYLDPKGQVLAAKHVGSIPSRTDTSQDPVVTDNRLLEPFAATATNNGVSYPDPVISPEKVIDVQTSMGQTWSAVVGGQTPPQEAAGEVTPQLQSFVGG